LAFSFGVTTKIDEDGHRSRVVVVVGRQPVTGFVKGGVGGSIRLLVRAESQRVESDLFAQRVNFD
jgi:hypothetical protein